MDAFTWDRYEQLVEMKTSHYTFFQPMEMALLVSDRMDSHNVVRRVAYQIGFLFQSQDDFLDIFGDPQLTGKSGSDIQEGKCTWVSVRAAEKLRGKPEFNNFEAHYGKLDSESVETIRKLLQQVNIPGDFIDFEKKYSDKAHYGKVDSESVETIRKLLQQVNIPRDFIDFEKKYSDKVD
ncbi:hypothetical protein DICVIV_09136 [Dictyocaulus viviparus]|uniref:Polyprenyl synthetase n=1 Tax=Dictyocaulus viviparus TaxID=29172 RepID=A0A0D8XM52_DICVI|nr:hypothetical protein DICVIV_09136 [Dictyocaulus viviparus]